MKKITVEIFLDDTNGYKGYGGTITEFLKTTVENEMRFTLQADGVIKEGWSVKVKEEL